MRKVLIAILVVALFSSFLVFADESNFLDLFDSVQFSTGFDMFMAKGKFNNRTDNPVDNNKFGFGVGLSTTFDLSAIPYFPSDDWRIYIGYDMFFLGNPTLHGTKYTSNNYSSSLGMKFHMAGLYHTMLGTPLDFYFGGGLAWDRISAKLSGGANNTLSASSWGISLYAETSYEFYRHFATFVTVIPDITFLTRLQSKGKTEGASVVVYKTSFGFGFDLSIKTGIKYVF